MSVSIFPFVLAVVGLLIWALAAASEKKNAIVTEIGRICFFWGVAGITLVLLHYQVKIG
jgi:hypothetical protein